MGRTKPSKERALFTAHINCPQSFAYLQCARLEPLLHCKNLFYKKPHSLGSTRRLWRSFVTQALALFAHDRDMCDLFTALNKEIQDNIASSIASHQECRCIINALGIRGLTEPIHSLLCTANTFEEASALVSEKYGLQLVLRERTVSKSQHKKYPRNAVHLFKRCAPLVESISETTPANAILCNESTGFYVLPPDKSAVFVSTGENGQYEVEMIVMRNVPAKSSSSEEYLPPLLSWLRETIKTACTSRRHQRPQHPGKMAQIGLNMGPRDARVLGWAKSFVAKLSPEEKKSQDGDLLGAMSLFWAVIKAYIPQDITGDIQESLDLNYPTMETDQIPAGCGFSIKVGEYIYDFKTSSRAPPEGYATLGYVAHAHTDACFTKWAFNWTVARDILLAHLENKPNGAAFVDLGIKTVVQACPGTLTAFQPEFLHGTTDTYGIKNYCLFITSTQRVANAIRELIERGQTVFQWLDVNRREVE